MDPFGYIAPLESGDYAVFFADSIFEMPDFTNEAMPGSYEIQRPHHGTLLYKTLPLPLPLPGVSPKSFTLGVQHVLSGGARSPFVLGTLTMPPLQGA